MKNLFLFLVLIVLDGTSEVKGQATANFTDSATIIQPIGINTNSNLNFASLEAKTGGTVILTPDNIRISTGGLN